MKFFMAFLFATTTYALEFTIYDELSSKPLKSTKVIVKRHNSIQCITTPCPSNEMNYTKKTDQNGLLEINEKHLLEDQNYLSIKVKDYNPARLDKVKNKKLYLTPMKITKDHRKLILINYSSKKIIPNTEVKFCTDKECKNIIFKEKSNDNGVLYYHYPTIFPKGLAQTEPVYLIIPGFKPYPRYQHHRGEAMFDF